MADNLGVSPGSGASLRTKELAAGVHAQVVALLTMIPTILTGNQTLSVATGADTTLTVPTGATHALMTVDTGGGDIRYWEDGSSPSASAGLLVPAGGAAELTNLGNVKLRATTGTVAINVSYRKYV
jgi:hypothetical protein